MRASSPAFVKHSSELYSKGVEYSVDRVVHATAGLETGATFQPFQIHALRAQIFREQFLTVQRIGFKVTIAARAKLWLREANA
jgi:hypothetical protein